MANNKEHWYDGLFYDKVIAPNQDTLFKHILNLIEPGSSVIDVGCGTGRFSFSSSYKFNSVLGIDLSKKNIERANITLAGRPDDKISFRHTSAREIILNGKDHFDYAVMTYVIHEVDSEERINLLNEISQIADKIIIGDYLYPRPKGFWNVLNEVVEFVAGKDHYRNFKTYLAEKGINGLAEKAKMKIIREIKNGSKTAHIVMMEKQI